MATRKQSQWQGSPYKDSARLTVPCPVGLNAIWNCLTLYFVIRHPSHLPVQLQTFCETLVWTVDYYYTENTLLHAKNFIYVMETFKQ